MAKKSGSTKKKPLLIPFDEILREEYNTPEKWAAFQKRVDEFSEECRKELLQELADEVKQARKRAGVTQEELAKRLKTQKSVISRIEKGDQNLTVNYVVKIAVALGRPYEVKIY